MIRFFIFLYQIIVWLPVFLVSTILTAIIVIIGCSCGGKRFFSYYPGVCWSKIICIFTLSPIKVIGKEKLDKKQSYVFVSNHQGAYDIFLIYGYLGHPIKWVMKQSLRKLFLVGMACEKAGFIFVDNSSPLAAARTVNEAKKRLQNGASIAIFPEGSRSRTGKLNVFKKGAYQMAIDLKLPIVPVTINGSYEVLPVHSFFIFPHKMELIIHDPIPTADLVSDNLRTTAQNIRQLLDKSRNKIESGLWEKYKGMENK
ncbi:MAG: 1-acyl-sn-glycerol-3-phosphate acyltransferase [Dysgonamonadaceae bacterium]|jgi:1-acyl-sn-glycerol-3-phosphate acyltransferase|nr:1-acyl-sn-glycerol-3-phosphate acyltransferase [Dysgonamonadaceae bacterium]